MMLRGDTWSDNDLVRGILGFVFGEKIGVDDTGRLDFQFDRSSEIKRKVEAVLQEIDW
jgi:ribosome-binding factor A